MWVDEIILRLSVKGLRRKDIVEEILNEWKLWKQEVKILTNSLQYIMKRGAEILLTFEQVVLWKYVDSDEWQIGDTPQPSSAHEYVKQNGLYNEEKVLLDHECTSEKSLQAFNIYLMYPR